MKKTLIFLILAQSLAFNALAQEDKSTKGGAGMPAKAVVEDDIYDVSDTIKKGRQVILDQKEQLQVKEEPESEEKEVAQEAKLEEAKIEARRQVFEQMVIQEVDVSRPTQTIEAEMRREQYRQEVMAAAGKEVRTVFKKKRFNIMVKETYDDNVFLTRRAIAKKDYITKISPSILYYASSKLVNIDANYVMDIVQYRFQEKQSAVNHLIFTDIRPGIASLPFFKGRGGKIGLEIQDTFRPAITNASSSEETSRTKRMTNNLLVLFDYYMSQKKTLALEYANNFEHYDKPEDRYQSSRESIITPKFYFRIRPKWSLMAAYDYGKKSFPKNVNDSRYQRLKVGATGRFLTKLLARFEAGGEWRDYDEPDFGKKSSLYAKGYFYCNFSDASRATLSYLHALQDSTTSGYPFYITDSLDFDYERKLTYKTKGLLGLTYVHNNYDKNWTLDNTVKIRQDEIYKASVALRYYLKKQFYLEGEYACEQRVSNFSAYEYLDNRYTVGANAEF